MKVAFDSTLAAGFFDNGGTLTTFSTGNIACNGGKRVLAVHIYLDSQTANTVTSVSYGNQTVTAAEVTRAGSFATNYSFRIINPVRGVSLPVIVTTNAVVGGNHQIGIVAVSYNGASQSAPYNVGGSNNTNSDTSTNFAVSATAFEAGSWLSGGAQADVAGSIGNSATPGSGTTYRSTLAGNLFGADSNGPVSLGTQTLNWGKTSASDSCVGTVMVIAPYIEPIVPFRPYLRPRPFAPGRAR